MGELVSIVYKPRDAAPVDEGYTRLPLQEAALVVGGGIAGDVKGERPTRQLNLMAVELVEQLADEGFHAQPGQLGEQLLLRGVELQTLQAGTRLQIGESACVEVTEPRTGCGKFERYQGKSRELAAGRLGMMARVVAPGVIRVGDVVRLTAE